MPDQIDTDDYRDLLDALDSAYRAAYRDGHAYPGPRAVLRLLDERGLLTGIDRALLTRGIPVVNAVLNVLSPEPPPGTIVVDTAGVQWEAQDAGWVDRSEVSRAPRTWLDVTSARGPVRVLDTPVGAGR